MMAERIVTYGTIVSFALGGLIYLQTNFVDAMDFQKYQYESVEDEVNYLRDRKLRLEQIQEELSFEDKRRLERLELKLQRINPDRGNI